MKQILIATKNKGKVREFKEFFSKYGIAVQSLLDADQEIPDIEETGHTFEENAALKAEQIAKVFNQPILADDSGLMIDALDGRPGIYSARYAGEEKSDKKNNEKVLQELKDIPENERTARFVCALAVALPQGDTIIHKGYVEGKIAFEPAGDNGFGYDPIFIPDGFEQTMAELSPELKNKISHRHDAIKKLEDWVKQL